MNRQLNARNEVQLALIRQTLTILEPFFRIRVTMTARSIQAFLLVAEKEGQSVTEYAKRADMPVTTMSRNLIDMTERDSRFEDGAGLIEGRDNPMNRREKVYTLTAKGRALLGSLTRGMK